MKLNETGFEENCGEGQHKERSLKTFGYVKCIQNERIWWNAPQNVEPLVVVFKIYEGVDVAGDERSTYL